MASASDVRATQRVGGNGCTAASGRRAAVRSPGPPTLPDTTLGRQFCEGPRDGLPALRRAWVIARLDLPAAAKRARIIDGPAAGKPWPGSTSLALNVRTIVVGGRNHARRATAGNWEFGDFL